MKRNRQTFLTPDEVLVVLRAAKDHSIRVWAMVLVCYAHGLRASEVCGLRLSDVDLRNKQMTIRRLKGSLTTTQPLLHLPGQPLLHELAALKAYLAERQDDGSGYLFLSQKGGGLDRSAFFRLFQSVAEAAGLPPNKRHCHVLKHARASNLIAGGASVPEVAQSLGHASWKSTMRYVGVSDEQAAKAAQKATMAVF